LEIDVCVEKPPPCFSELDPETHLYEIKELLYYLRDESEEEYSPILSFEESKGSFPQVKEPDDKLKNLSF
jgi:hypothetical protein